MSELPEWHLNSHEGQEGPFTTAFIQELWNTGAIHGACHVWKEGFEDWQEIQQVDSFAAPAVDRLPEEAGSGAGTEQSRPPAEQLADALSASGRDEDRKAFYDELAAGGILLVASYGLPAHLVPGLNVASSDLDVTVATARNEEGQQLLLAFTSESAIRRRFPSAEGIGLNIRNVLQMVLDSDHAGLLINAGGASVRVPAGDMPGILERISDGEA